MKNTKKFFKGIIIFIIFIIVIGAIRLKIEGKRILPSIIKYSDINNITNYGEVLLNTLTNASILDDIFYNNKNYSAGNILIKDDAPIIYIYNTHQKEEYGTFDKTVLDASIYLKEKLERLNIPALVEQRDIIALLNESGNDYPYTYTISRTFVMENQILYPSLKVFIDLHRDSVPKEISTADINNKSYAKLMFLVGKDNPRYQENEKHVKIIEEYLTNNYPGLVRNTYYRNDTYNQQISTYLFSIEVGANYNTIEEVYNSLDALAEALNYLLEAAND